MEHIRTIKNRDFTVIYDKEQISQELNNMRETYEDEKFIEERPMPTPIYIGKEKFNKNIDEALKKLDEYTDSKFLDNVLLKAKKNKDGAMAKNRVYKKYTIKNRVAFLGWGTDSTTFILRFKTTSNTEMILELIEIQKIY